MTRLSILCLQPHDKAGMLGVKIVEFFSKNLLEYRKYSLMYQSIPKLPIYNNNVLKLLESYIFMCESSVMCNALWERFKMLDDRKMETFVKILFMHKLYCSTSTIKILISNWPRTRKFSQLFRNTGGEDLFLPRSRVGHALHPIFMLWLVKIWQVSSCAKIYAASLNLITCDVFNCLCPLDVQNEIQLLSRVFCYSWLVCLLFFWLRDASLVKVGNLISDGIIFIFHLAWCVRGFKSLSFQELHLEW